MDSTKPDAIKLKRLRLLRAAILFGGTRQLNL
jgi:hypothetical protein